MGRIVSNCWPTKVQESLLRACLLSGDQAVTEWRQWKAAVDNNSIDQGSKRMLPLLYRNLRDQGISESSLLALKDQYFEAWSQNKFAFHQTAGLISEFNRAGIRNMILKGAPLALLFYQDVGLRPMMDVDVLVTPEQARLAIRLLEDLGWKSRYPSPEAFIPFEHAAEFKSDGNQSLDLHWRVFWEGRQYLSDDDFWSASIDTEFNGVPTRSLNATDQLLHTCVHGAKWNDTPSLRWVADAMFIVRSQTFEVDWERLLSQARKRGLTLPMADTLGYLNDLLNAYIPVELIGELRRSPVSKLDSWFYQARLGNNDALRSVPIMWHWSDSLRLECRGGSFHRLSQFFLYLRSLWSVKYTWQIPFYLVGKPLKRIYGTLTKKSV